MDTDLHDALDRSFDHGPTPAPTALLVAAGRRRLRRRRLAQGTAALAVVGVALSGAAVATGGIGERPEAPVAGSPTTGAAPYDVVVDEAVTHDVLAVLDKDGGVRVSPDVELVRLVPNPYDAAAPARSVAAVLERDGRTVWWAEYTDGERFRSTATGRPGDAASFEGWVADQSEITDESGSGPTRYVRFRENGELEAANPDVEILEQQSVPDNDAFAGPDDRSAAARILFDGQEFYALVTAPASDLDQPTFTLLVARAHGRDSFDDFIADYVTGVSASGVEDAGGEQ